MRSCARIPAVLIAFALLAVASVASADQGATEKAFAPGGRVRLDLSAGDYTIRAGRDDRIHVQWHAAFSDAWRVAVDVRVTGSDAVVRTKGPRNNFRVVIELPSRTDLKVDLSAGELRVGGIAGNKDVGLWAGDILIDVGRADDYARVHASVTAGDINASPFGGHKEGLFRSFTWRGPGRYSLKVDLTAGNVTLR